MLLFFLSRPQLEDASPSWFARLRYQAGKLKRPAREAADDDVPDFEVPSELTSKKKVRMSDTAPFEISLQTFSGDCALFGFPGPREPGISAIYDHAAYPSLVFKQSETREQFHNEKMQKTQLFPKAPTAWTRRSS